MNLTWIIPLGLAYCLGSIPTALIVSHLVASTDIRLHGDGNMGARNTSHVLGWKAGWAVAGVDIGKGAGSIWLAQTLGLAPFWQVLTGACAVLGHDFPIFAGFRGGQGLATTMGTFFILAPHESLYGLGSYLVIYLLTRNFDLSAGIGVALLVFQTWRFGEPTEFLIGEIAIVLLVPIKKLLDRHQHVILLGNPPVENGLPAVSAEDGKEAHENSPVIHG
jgi:glycerol-3-phosphate acyltransferase PlsY